MYNILSYLNTIMSKYLVLNNNRDIQVISKDSCLAHVINKAIHF